MEEEKKDVNDVVEEEDENIDDTDLEEEEEDKEEQSDDSEKEEPKKEKKQQSRQENAKYAALRKKNKELQEKVGELEVKAQKADFNAEKKVIKQSTLEDLGLESIDDEDDLLLCKEYEKAEKKGSDNPVRDANLALRNKLRERKNEQVKQEESDKKLKEEVAKDSQLFYDTYKITPAQALQDKKFMDAYGDLIEGGNLTKLYGKYKALTKTDSDDEEDEDSKKAKGMGKIPTSSNKKASSNDLMDLDGDAFLKAFRQKYN